MLIYSLLLGAVLLAGSPYWLWRMATSGRYRAGLGERLGRVPARLRETVAGRPVVWVHAVSVGEVLAAARLIAEMETARPELAVVLSTTTKTGQELAAARLGAGRVFYFPLDFAFAVRAYLRALRPKLVVLMESELWPRLLVECERSGAPVAVVNGRVSDRSLPRYRALRALWRPLLRKLTLLLAQSEEDARRFVEIGAVKERVHAVGNLKYDVRAPKESRIAELIRETAAGRPVIVAGSTVDRESDKELDENEMVMEAWGGRPRREMRALLVLAPRHPQFFGPVYERAREFAALPATKMLAGEANPAAEIVVLDTIGDLAAVYGVADIAFVGGSLVARGGHNPLEPAQFGVPVVMGPSFENFREIVARMRDSEAICIVSDRQNLEAALMEWLMDRAAAQAAGARGRAVYETEAGATARTVRRLLDLLKAGA